jgi:hypothetical protein
VQVARGLAIQRSELRQSQTYTARNEDATARDLFIEHPVRPDWTLGEAATPEETTAEFHRFRITVEPGTTTTLVVDETRPIETRYAISSLTNDQVELFVRGAVITDEVEQALREVLSRKAAIADLTTRLNALDTEIVTIAEDQERVRENMRALGDSSEERQLVQRYVRQLDAQETRLEALRTERASLTAERNQAQDALNQFIVGISG